MTRQQNRIRMTRYGLGTTDTQIAGGVLMTAGGLIAATGVGALPGAIVTAVGALVGLVGGLFTPDLTKVQATNIVNQIELQVLKPMLASWQALPPERKTRSVQAVYLATFNDAWNNVMKACSNPALGEAGQACISDRIQNACHWTVDGQTPGTPGNCGNWFVWFRDPILYDPQVHDDFSPVGSVAGSVSDTFSSLFGDSTTGGGGFPVPLMVGVGLIGLALVMGSD